ncbi:hypothetical protein [Demequina mangrovi]|uniref:Uncharacterized protein n=1 Tax=Demequina mangrovi TaxID=1043493 RepID=A0A1H6VXR9_9MICO|nr:hypothetical protein [Demequina mangrovi]SEJ09471.1 hypothetical protein SAMN05421637_0754 [Demequina mangrovi]
MTRDAWGWEPVHETRGPSDVAPSKPAAPRAPVADPSPVPVPVDPDIDQVTAPLPGPAAEEILPEPWSPLDGDRAPAAATDTPRRSSYEALGAAAAANAALHASGAAHTPLAGVPVVSGLAHDHDHAPVSDAPGFVPIFAGAETAGAAPAWHAVAESPAPSPRGPEEQAPALYRPRVAATSSASTGPAPSPDDAPLPGEGGAGAAAGGGTPVGGPERRPGRAWPLILIGLILLGAAFAAAWLLLLRPEAVTLPEQSVLTAPSEPAASTLEPFVAEDPTPFLAAMPTVAGDWTLTDATPIDVDEDKALPDRVAEGYSLTYSDGTATVVVRARQLYSEDDAAKALTKAAGEGAAIDDATVAGTVVGLRTERSREQDDQVLWTNGSAYFVAVGDRSDIDDLLSTLGL